MSESGTCAANDIACGLQSAAGRHRCIAAALVGTYMETILKTFIERYIKHSTRAGASK